MMLQNSLFRGKKVDAGDKLLSPLVSESKVILRKSRLCSAMIGKALRSEPGFFQRFSLIAVGSVLRLGKA